MAKEYKVSIVTPFHDIDMNIFKNGFMSIKNQTIGFSNIQWIVVIHNSETEYEKAVHEMLDQYDNIVIKELHNEKKTPSSPRNYGIELATAKYIGFLDGDDSFLPNCLQKVVEYMDGEEVQIVSFRREYELESENSRPVTEIVLWNQTKEKIVFDRDNWDDEKMFSGVCGMVTSRLYDREFLNTFGLRFDESVLFGEDFLFNLEAYGHADKVMYLPQLIGYHYFINGGSLVQKGGKSPETLVSYAEGYTKIFEAGLKYGFFMNSIISRLCVVLGKFLAASNDLTLEDRLKIKEMLEPYILLTTPLKESKIYSKKAVQECYEFPRYIILQPEKWMADQGELLINLPSEYSISENPMHTSLTKILENNLDTDMGLQYGFRSIMTMNGYTAKVPLHDYDTYEPLIKLTTRIGESRIFSADPVIYYTMSRGLYGGEKLFPHTQSHLSTFGSAFKKMVKGKNNLLLAESLPGTVKFNDQAVMNSVWGMALSSYESMNSLKSKTSGTRFTSPKEILFPTKPLNTIFVRLLFALADREVEQIVAVSTWSILSSIRHLQIHWESICDDIENGTLGIDSDFDSNLIEIVNSNFKKSKERADELRSIFKAGFDKDILKKIWPKLKRIIAENDGIYSLYTSQLKLYSGDIEIEGGYLLRDCNVIGEPSSNSKFYKLMTDDTFYEFIPISDSTFDGKLLQAKELKVGEEYEVVITNNSGLYRFKTREIICVEEMNDDMPLFSISHTKFDGIMLKSGTNENILHPGIIGKAIAKVSSEVGIPVSDFTYADSSYYDNTEGISLLVIIEASGLPDELNALLEFGKDKLCDMLDYELKKSFISYKELRENGELSLKVEIGEPETNLFYYDMKRFADELVQDQITPVKHLSTPEKYKFFVNRIM